MNFFSRLWAALFGTFKNILPFLGPVVKAYGPIIDKYLPNASKIITDLENSDLSGPAKFGAAGKMLGDLLRNQGINVPQFVIDTIVQIAVSNLKTK